MALHISTEAEEEREGGGEKQGHSINYVSLYICNPLFISLSFFIVLSLLRSLFHFIPVSLSILFVRVQIYKYKIFRYIDVQSKFVYM